MNLIIKILQVTQGGDPVCDLCGKTDKKPFERIIFGSVKCRGLKNPENGKVIISVPSAVHSHKPPLTGIYKNLNFLVLVFTLFH